MRERASVTQTLQASDARVQWDSILDDVSRGERRVLVEKDGVPVAAIVTTEDLKRLDTLEAARDEAFQALWRTGEAFKDQSPEQIERDVAAAIQAARVKRRAEQSRAATR